MSAVEEVVAEEVAEVAEVADTGPKMSKKISGITKDSVITVLADTNPKRASSAAFTRFEGYLTDPAPTTVQEALDNGLTIGDIQYDAIHGSIAVEGAEVTEYEVTPRGPRSETAEVESTEEVEVDAEGTDSDEF